MVINWIGSPFFGYPNGVHGRKGYQPLAIVMHIAEGTLAGCDGWFNSKVNARTNGGSSSSYAVGREGQIHQYVMEADAAWANGPVHNPSWKLLISNANPNLYTISIEHEGHTGDPWTDEMLNADVWLIRQIAHRWQIPLDRDHIIGHCEIDSVNRPRCPGTGLPWDTLLKRLKETM